MILGAFFLFTGKIIVSIWSYLKLPPWLSINFMVELIDKHRAFDGIALEELEICPCRVIHGAAARPS
jgi:hypothetical protein